MVVGILNFGKLILLRKIATLICLNLHNLKVQNQVKFAFSKHSAQNYTRAYTNGFLVHLPSGLLALDGNLVKYCLVMLNLVKSC